MQVLSLKDQLNEAKKEIEKLANERSSAISSTADNISSNSPSSSLTTMDYHPNLINPQILVEEQFGMEGCFYDTLFYVPENVPNVDWVDLYM